MKVNIPILMASFLVALGLWFARRIDRQDMELIDFTIHVSPFGLDEKKLVIVKMNSEIKKFTLRVPKTEISNIKILEGYVNLTNASKEIENYPVDIGRMKEYLIEGPPLTKVTIDNYKVKSQVPVKIETKGDLQDRDRLYVRADTSPSVVDVSGAESLVDKVTKAKGELDLQTVDSESPAVVDLHMYDSNDNPIVPEQADALRLSTPIVRVTPVLAIAPSEKDVVVSPDLVKTPPEGYVLDGYVITPTQVKLRGPSINVARINQIKTIPIDISNMTESKSFVVDLKLPPKTLIIGNKSKATIEVRIKKVSSVVAAPGVPR